jgi:hypothetical protein
MEVQNYRAPETLCSTDVGVTLYRRLAAKIARQSKSKESISAEDPVHNDEKQIQRVAT